MLDSEWESSAYLAYWPMSERLKRVLDEKKITTISYTMPGLKTDTPIPLKDGLPEDVKKMCEENFKQVDFKKNVEDLGELISQGHLEAAFNATTELLTLMGFGLGQSGKPNKITAEVLQHFTTRFQLMMALEMHTQLVEELLPFEELDAPDLYYEYHDREKGGSMVPFSFRLIHAESHRFTPFPWKAAEQIQKLERSVRKVIASFTPSEPEKHIIDWKNRLIVVQRMRVRVLYELEEYELCMECYEKFRQHADDKERGEISMAMLRLAISMGDEKAFNKYAEHIPKETSNKVLHHKAFKSLFLGAFPHAQDYMTRMTRSEDEPQWVWNSIGVFQMYTGQVAECLKTFAQHENVEIDSVVSNVKTFVEIGCPLAEKQDVLEQVLKYPPPPPPPPVTTTSGTSTTTTTTTTTVTSITSVTSPVTLSPLMKLP